MIEILPKIFKNFVFIFSIFPRIFENFRGFSRKWEYADSFDDSPTTTSHVAKNGGSFDELHIVVEDEDGEFSGLAGTIMETFSGASVSSGAKSEDGQSNYYKDIVSECSFDSGGYSIINGNEKVIISQEKITPNIIQVYPSKANSKYAYVSEVRSSRDNTFGITKTISVKITNKSNIYNLSVFKNTNLFFHSHLILRQ